MLPLTQFRQWARLLAITHILATHGMAALAVRMRLFRPYAWLVRLFSRGEALPDELGVHVRNVLERLGPTFIKFGQMLSTRVDLLPMEMALELKKLQDEVPPEDFTTIRGVIERVFRKPLLGESGVFRSFEETPVAAASIAQVHFAELHDGSQVAVKVRRPQIKRTIEADLSLLRLLARMFDRYFPEYHRLKAPRVVEEFAATIREELNLRAEAAHAARFAQNLAGLDGVGVPGVIWGRTNIEVLTTERIEGIPIDERERLKAASHDPMNLCERLATLFFHMAFVDGYFHADLHPGNIFVSDSDEILLVDFGIVGRLNLQSRRYLAEMILAFLKQDYRRAAEVHLEAGYVPAGTDVSAFEDAMREIAEPIFNRPLAEISLAELLFYLFSVTERFQMETQPELLLLQKTMVVIEGVARELEPETNVWALARPLVAEWVAKHLGPKARVEQTASDLRRGVENWLKLPDELRLFIQKTQAGPHSIREEIPVWIELFGVALLASGSGTAVAFWQQGFTAWQGPSGLLAAAIGAALLLQRH